MNEIHLSPKKVIELMSDRDRIVGQGTYGLVTPYDYGSLIKIYYKLIFDAYYYSDEAKLIDEISIRKSIEQDEILISSDYREALDRENKKLEILESIGLVKAKVFCNDYLIGVLLNYYLHYNELIDIFHELSINERKIVLNKIKQYLYFLMSRNIYPGDIKENNILVRKEDLDIKFIDLDDQETRYEEKEYAERFPHIEQQCEEKYDKMCRRLMI